MTITALGFSTALPYLGAVAILNDASLTAAQWLPLLLLGAYRLFGARLRLAFERWRERLQGVGRETLLWILGIAGFLLLADSLRYFGLFETPDASRRRRP